MKPPIPLTPEQAAIKLQEWLDKVSHGVCTIKKIQDEIIMEFGENFKYKLTK